MSERTVHCGRESEDAVHHPRRGIHTYIMVSEGADDPGRVDLAHSLRVVQSIIARRAWQQGHVVEVPHILWTRKQQRLWNQG